MNKLIILICMILIPLHINAISINEIRNNPSQFKLVYSDETREAYVDNSAISVTRYNPPYYAINATIYSVWYDRNIIVETNQTSFYNYERSIEKLSHKYKDVDEIVKEVSNDTGVRWKANTFVFYDFNGNMLSSKPLSNHDLSDIDALKDNVATNTSNIASINQYLDSINFKLMDIESSISNINLRSLIN